MFEEYLEDANYFASQAKDAESEKAARRFYRASVFCAMSAIEAFINEIGDTFSLGGDAFPPYEIAFLTDRKFGIPKGSGDFEILESSQYHRLEDKIRFLINKFLPGFDFKDPMWSRFKDFKKLRDSLVHPREAEDSMPPSDYNNQVRLGLGAIGDLMNALCQGIFKRPLRLKLKELSE